MEPNNFPPVFSLKISEQIAFSSIIFFQKPGNSSSANSKTRSMKQHSLQALLKATEQEQQKPGSEPTSAFSTISQSLNVMDEKKIIHETMVSIINKDHPKYKTNSPFSELKRAIFLRFVLSFGLNFIDITELHQKLVKFSPGQFERGKDEETACNQYLEKFLALIYHFSNPIIDRCYIEFYLFNFERAQIYKRICQLIKLKKHTEQCNGDPRKFCFEKTFEIILPNSKGAVRFGFWNAAQDYLLSSMILEKGFGRWQAILESKGWEKYIRNDQSKHTQIKYRDYLRLFLYDDRKTVPIPFHLILQERAIYYLKLVK